MANDQSKQEYLKRYLEDSKKDVKKRKRKSKTSSCVSRLKILDENIDLKSIIFDGGKDSGEDDEAPVIAEIVDERPLEVKVKELYESSRWKKIGSDSGIDGSDTHVQNESSLKKSTNNNSNERSVLKNKTGSKFKTRHDSDSDISPIRNQRGKRNSDSDISPPRNSRKSTKNSDSDISPPRIRSSTTHRDLNESLCGKNRHVSYKKNISMSNSKTSNRRRHDSDSDRSQSSTYKYHKSRHDSESSDETEKNHVKKFNHNSTRKQGTSNYRAADSDSDISPPRADTNRTAEIHHSRDADIRPKKTLSGLKAGLQNATTLKKETQELRDREKKQINMLNEELSGRNARTIIRDRKTGLKRNLEAENQKKEEEQKKVIEHQKKYMEWGKGVEQTEKTKNKLEDDIYEMSKPLARYCDDEDLEEKLKSVIRDEDPMSEYMRKKQKRNLPNVPTYSGPPPPPNRFGIPPGYRWDGVDRSNGFEKRYFEKCSKSKAMQEEAYLWSVQNM